MNKYLNKIFLNHKNILVTGATGLLGTEICKGIAQYKGNVLICDIDETKGKRLEEFLNNNYEIKATFYHGDITSEESVDNLLGKIVHDVGSIYGLVNCAYPRNKSYGTHFENIQLDSWIENVNMHLGGYFNITQKISKYMIEKKEGNIINFSSIYGMLGPDFSIYEGTQMTMPAEYSAIKGGITNFTRYLATYLAEYGIRVNSISPGGIEDSQNECFMSRYSNKTPLKRMGTPEEIVGGVIYLLSDMSSYVTGHNLVIDGGWSAW